MPPAYLSFPPELVVVTGVVGSCSWVVLAEESRLLVEIAMELEKTPVEVVSGQVVVVN